MRKLKQRIIVLVALTVFCISSTIVAFGGYYNIIPYRASHVNITNKLEYLSPVINVTEKGKRTADIIMCEVTKTGKVLFNEWYGAQCDEKVSYGKVYEVTAPCLETIVMDCSGKGKYSYSITSNASCTFTKNYATFVMCGFCIKN